MRILVLGGSVFCSREVAARAASLDHDVTAACRGVSGSVPDGVRHVAWDRSGPPPAGLVEEDFDAVVDVARLPSRVRRDVACWSSAHWVLVSTINVYAEEVPGGSASTLPLMAPHHDDADLADLADQTAYGPMKVACELAVQDSRQGAASASVVRPGLIVGPGDPTGRFTYWPARLSDVSPGEEVLAPGDPDDGVQVVDVRDLAAWLVDLADRRWSGVVDGVGPVLSMAETLAAVADGVGADPVWTWVDQDTLAAEGVEAWMGPGSVPLWLPRPAYDGMLGHDPEPAREAGLTCRPLAETARDTAAWLRATPGAAVSGICRERERHLLEVFRGR